MNTQNNVITTQNNVIITNADTLLDAIRGEIKKAIAEVRQEEKEGKEYVYGLDGIAKLFGVSKVTASIYKRTFLAEAILQRGRQIVCDVEKAKRLFNESRDTNFFEL